MPIPYHPRRPKPLAIPTEEDVAEAVVPKADDPAPPEELDAPAAEEREERRPDRDDEE